MMASDKPPIRQARTVDCTQVHKNAKVSRLDRGRFEVSGAVGSCRAGGLAKLGAEAVRILPENGCRWPRYKTGLATEGSETIVTDDLFWTRGGQQLEARNMTMEKPALAVSGSQRPRPTWLAGACRPEPHSYAVRHGASETARAMPGRDTREAEIVGVLPWHVPSIDVGVRCRLPGAMCTAPCGQSGT
jgi:hypothetical protein